MDSISIIVRNIVEQIVDHPEQIQINEVKSSQVTLIELNIAKEDNGLLIGKKGKVITSLRNIVDAAIGKQGMAGRIYFQIIGL
ncbi:MAG: KH domain-containing protein [Desulfobacteraceae bacterium]|nr:KH domain-containing protein [Desulfobacteraceae bacterium]